jgi:hypothetical protein
VLDFLAHALPLCSIECLPWLDGYDFAAVKGQRDSRLRARKREIQLVVIAVMLPQAGAEALTQKEPQFIRVEIGPVFAEQVLRHRYACSLSISLIAAGASGFLTLIQSGDRPDR